MYRREKRAMKFGIPWIWREPTNQSTNCYFCIVNPYKRRFGKNALAILYVDIPSSLASVSHNPQLIVPIPPVHQCGRSTKTESDEDEENNITSEAKNKKPYFSNQCDLNDLIRDFDLKAFIGWRCESHSTKNSSQWICKIFY